MAVACGYDFSVAVTEDGDLFSFGGNKYGELGTGKLPGRAAIAGNIVPTRVSGLPAPVRQVAAGRSHTGIVTDAGDLFMCGSGKHGQLGLDVFCNNRSAPTLVDRSFLNNKKVLMVSCGDLHTVTLTEGGVVYTWGDGSLGRLGHGNQDMQVTPKQVPAASFTPNGSPDGAGERIVMVAAGNAHTVALSEAGHVFTWGYGGFGQLGHENTEDLWAPRQVEAGRFALEGGGSGQVEKVVFVAAGNCYTVAVTWTGSLFTWGYGWLGRLGHDDDDNRLVPTLVGAGAFEGSAVVMASCGFEHTMVVTQDGALWACGWGAFGQLGLNDTADRHVFERVEVEAFGDARVVTAAAGYFNSAAVTEDGALWTWGKGLLGQLGHGNEQNHLVPVKVTEQFSNSKKIGRCRELSENDKNAVLMSTNNRLGGNSLLHHLDPYLLIKILDTAISWPKGLTKQHEGLGRLLGAGLISLKKWPDFKKIKQAVKTTLRACAKVCRPCTVRALTQNL